MRLGKQGKLGKQNPTYAYARARDGVVGSPLGETIKSILSANCFPSFPSFPQKEKTGLKTEGYKGLSVASLLPIAGRLLPYLPTTIQDLAESGK